MIFVVVIICVTNIILTSIVYLPSFAKRNDDYKEVEIIEIYENNGYRGYSYLKSFRIYYKDEYGEKSGNIPMFSSYEFKKKIMDLDEGQIIKIKQTGGFNFIYDIEIG